MDTLGAVQRDVFVCALQTASRIRCKYSKICATGRKKNLSASARDAMGPETLKENRYSQMTKAVE